MSGGGVCLRWPTVEAVSVTTAVPIACPVAVGDEMTRPVAIARHAACTHNDFFGGAASQTVYSECFILSMVSWRCAVRLEWTDDDPFPHPGIPSSGAIRHAGTECTADIGDCTQDASAYVKGESLNVIVFPGRYRMDYMAFVDHHREHDADITVGALPVGYDRASDFGLMKIDQSGRWGPGGRALGD